MTTKIQLPNKSYKASFFRSIMSLAVLSTTLIFTLNVAYAGNNAAQNIRSVSQVKNKIRDDIALWTNAEACAGTCLISHQLGICRSVEDLDMRVRGKISGIIPKRKYSLLHMSKSDLQLMRLIYNACKPIAKKDLPRYIHIEPGEQYKIFAPSSQSLIEIKSRLGLNVG